MASKKTKPFDPNDDSVETGRLSNESPRPVAPSAVAPFVGDPLAPLHALDSCPVNSKIVVTESGAFLATPESLTKLPPESIEARLPLSTKIHKLAEGQYRGKLPAEYSGTTVVYDNTNDVLTELRRIVTGE